MKSNFKRNLLISFGFSLVLLMISSVASYFSIQKLTDNARLVDHTNQVIQQLEETISILKDAETGQRGFLLTGEEQFLTPYNGAYDSAVAHIRRLKELIIDNPVQIKSCDRLNSVVLNRLASLKTLIDKKRENHPIEAAELRKGKLYMDEARDIVTEMGLREQQLLSDRTVQMDKFADFTPILIVLVAILSIAITSISFLRINKDFDHREALQKELLHKDEDITRRINIIRGVADKVSGGDYGIRVEDSGEDGLGNVAFSLNKMAASLQESFTLLSDKEWLQAGLAGLNDKMLGEYNMKDLGNKIISFVANYTKSQAGAFYLVENNGLRLISGYALGPGNKEHVAFGEGITGQCVVDGKEVVVQPVSENQMIIPFTSGGIKPAAVIAFPFYYEHMVTGVLELASVNVFTGNDLLFLRTIAHNIGVVINSVENRKKLQELLEETQSQAEELQAQHNELENINEELEMQAQKLQASEEELKVQQEELVEANVELEERARLLEERNQEVFEQNIDIQKKAEELALSTKYKSEFLANMSHELRTPLNSILLLSRLMSENNQDNLNEEQIEYAKVIFSSGKGLLTLIDEILDLSKIEAGKMDLQYGTVTVAEVANDMISMFQPVANEKQVKFSVEVSAEVPATIETDKLRLEQIVRNLISNALKFTSKGYVRMDVHTQENDSAFIVFLIKDTGIGIAHEKQHLIFEAFQQEDGSTRRKYGGTGLGLSISRELTKLLGGEIKLKSEPGEGSEFSVIIPVSQAQKKEIAVPEQPAVVVPAQPVLPKRDTAKRYIAPVIPESIPDDRDKISEDDKVILIVEDDVNFAKALLEFTHKKDYKGVVTVRGDEALLLARRYMPVGILLDIELPVKDGWEVMEELKGDPGTKHIPVHIMSSHEVKYKSLSEGAIDFINKPAAFDKIDDIFHKLEYVLNHNPRKVLIVEENTRHAKALAYFLETFNVNTEIKNNVNEGITALRNKEVNCVILDMGIPDHKSYETLEEVKKTTGLENIPIIIFTGKSLSKSEELRIKQYADSIVIKTAHSYQRILDEVTLFLHLVEAGKTPVAPPRQYRTLGAMQDVLKGKTVLVADDDVRNIYSLSRALENFEMTVISAVDGKEALKQLEAHPETHVVLMDMMMPEMDGYETTKIIKNMPKYRNLPVIAVTAKAMTGDREKCISAGASDYITKPVDIDQLLSLLRVWLYDSGKNNLMP
ncbi:MAG: response regulator [Chitinophagaceae bacterium]